jgi:serine protease AprX
MIKIARLPNPTFAVADLDFSDQCLSQVPLRDTDVSKRPPALSKPAGPRSTGVEAMKMRAKYLFLAIALLCLLAVPATALAADTGDGSKIDTSVTTVLDATGGDEAVPVIVYADPGAGGVVQGAVPAGVETTELAAFDAVAAYLTAEEIDALALSDAVDLIVADNPVFGFDYQSSLDVTNLAIGLDKVASPAEGGPTGAGVGVAVLDSGVATTSDLGDSRIVAWKDFVNKKKAPYDDAGHGTFVAGLIAGDGTASLPLDQGGVADVQFRGVAPQANIIGVKVLDGTGSGRSSAVMAGVLWAVAHKDEYNIRVLNLSIGSNPVAPADFDPIAKAVEFAWKNGVTVVCAAGNEGEFGHGGILSPGNSPYVITVGATDTRQTATLADDAVTYYSSVGPTLWDEYAKPDLVAPGNRLISLRVTDSFIDVNFPQNLIPVASYAPTAPADTEPSYLMLSGTSTSAPVCAGVATIMIGEDPALSPDDVKVRMMGTADPLPGASRFQQGAGLVDAAGALASDAQSNGYALSEDVGDGTTILTQDDYAAWDQVAWTKYGWTKFKWTKFKWTKFKWTSDWTKFKWTKFKWTGTDWTKFKWTKFKWTSVGWTKFKWTSVGWTKFKWTGVDWTKFKWTAYDWAKFKWTILIEGQ